ncbi:hypothetical protein AVEN_195580-1 [Araneus ventricosus]|uniref:CCHC-type domain-containing protein n=1 Tax=Araneus ventricosus TaxID=182803 RepID=A0A4Y2B935_ARAVE|nr:hypothetical protein AVEN_195580-1 [Araneus ventricosus]
MYIFAGARKCDLKILAEELGETVNDNHKLKDLKKMILASKEYDEESAKEWLNTVLNERKEREENERRNEEIQIAERRRQNEIAEQRRQDEIAEQRRQDEIAERRRQDEIQIAEQKRQDEVAERRGQDEIQIAEQKRQEEIELRKLEYEERKRKDEMEFELQKIRLGAEDQLKRKVSQEVKDHFIDDWSKLNLPDDLVEKLDDYDTLRSTLRSTRPHKEWHYDKQNSLKDDSAFTTNGNKKLYGITHNERGEPKCFHCSNFGHIARNCSLPK